MSDLVLTDVGKSFPTQTEPLQILENVSLEMTRGQNLAILGPSGSGKSTLLQIAGTLDSPTSGSVELCGTNPFELDERALAAFRNKNIGFVFQDHHLLKQLSAVENVLIPRLAEGPTTAQDMDRAKSLLDQVGLGHRLDHRPSELSGGERQRVSIARALMNQPSLLLADEPTGNLDQANAELIGQLLIDVQQSAQPATMLMVVTHSPALAAGMQQTYQLKHRRLVKQTESQE
ncbi:MAG: ABC transporter ATP-binding protein [Planctomycetales bacterium]|nr:ABC transporter ATP-binding protein [Planctomycetales bacterium]